jgi:hypothetical protein
MIFCKDCRFWGGIKPNHFNWTKPPYDVARGTCHKIVASWDAGPGAPAVVDDGSEYVATLSTAAQFGCILAEPKEAKENL